MKTRRQSGSSLNDALMEVLEPLAAARRQPIDRLRLAWPFICGADLAQCTQPAELVGSSLVLDTLDEYWSRIVQTLTTDLLTKIKGVAPSVLSITTRVNPSKISHRDTNPARAPRAAAAPEKSVDIEDHLESFVSAWRARPYRDDPEAG